MIFKGEGDTLYTEELIKPSAERTSTPTRKEVYMNNIGQIISEYRKKTNITQMELTQKLSAEGIQVSNRTVSAWENGKLDPGARTFLYLCRILQIPDCVEAFFGNNPSDPMAILNDAGKAKVLAYIDSLVHPVCYAKETTGSAEVIPFTDAQAQHRKRLRVYETRVSAGRGNFLDSEFYTMFDVDENMAAGADFGVTISGDSMEPKYHDHDMIFVHSQETLENGEIGIFSLNGNAYIKKYLSDETGTFLISLNKKYDPIPVNPEMDSFRIFGRVCGQ